MVDLKQWAYRTPARQRSCCSSQRCWVAAKGSASAVTAVSAVPLGRGRSGVRGVRLQQLPAQWYWYGTGSWGSKQHWRCTGTARKRLLGYSRVLESGSCCQRSMLGAAHAGPVSRTPRHLRYCTASRGRACGMSDAVEAGDASGPSKVRAASEFNSMPMRSPYSADGC
jgi:hypothetical protein